jgi:hypothetical protein
MPDLLPALRTIVLLLHFLTEVGADRLVLLLEEEGGSQTAGTPS